MPASGATLGLEHHHNCCVQPRRTLNHPPCRACPPIIGIIGASYHVQVRKAYKLYRLGGVVSEILYSPAAYGLDMSAKNMPRPKARLGAQVCVPCAQPTTLLCVSTSVPAHCFRHASNCCRIAAQHFWFHGSHQLAWHQSPAENEV